MNWKCHNTKSAFTLVEILAAMVFMAIVVPAAVQGVLLASKAGISAERKRVAAQLADTMMNQLLVTEDWVNGDQSGDFEDYPGYRWEMKTETWETDTMKVVTMQVFYKVQTQEYSVILTTLASDEEEA